MNAMAGEAQGLTVVKGGRSYPKVRLTEPSPAGFLVLALEIDRRPPFLFGLASRAKRQATRLMKAHAGTLPGARVFTALLVPPGRGAYLRSRPEVPAARFDLVLLAEFETPGAARNHAAGPAWQALEAGAGALARRALSFTATNIRRMGPVDHDRQGVFLFNWFFADDLGQNLAVWDYTAGWFMAETGLDNSTVLLPDAGQGGPHTIVNHCRWNRLGDILPALLLKPDFRRYVLANFEANRTAAMPVLYRMA